MPDGLNPCRQSEGRSRQFVSDGRTIGKDKKKVKCSADRSYAAIDIDVPTSAAATTTTESSSPSPPPGKKPRAKESSAHFGVRFRPDLHKWVAEIRVFEWKSVDKKVWLGTFDSELGAACAVDAARKLLKCQKKREPNVPCAALAAYKESIPSHLQLTNITEEGMFKEVTMFVKRKAQEYAAELCTSQGAAVGLREQLVAPQQYHQIPVGDGSGSCFHLTPDVEPPSRPLFAVPEDDVFPPIGSSSSYGTNESFGSYVTQLPSCDGAVNMSHYWGYSSPPTPTSITYSSGPSSCTSSEGTSPEDSSWVQVQPSMWTEEALQGWSREAGIGGEYCLVAPPPSWPEDQMSMPVPMGMDEQTTVEFEVEDMEYLFNIDMEQECGGGDRAVDPMMTSFLENEEAQAGAQVMYIDNQYRSWTFQQSFNSLSYNPLSNSFENREVC